MCSLHLSSLAFSSVMVDLSFAFTMRSWFCPLSPSSFPCDQVDCLHILWLCSCLCFRRESDHILFSVSLMSLFVCVSLCIERLLSL